MAGTLPENRAAFSLAEIARITSGTLSAPESGESRASGVTTDSRADVSGRLFVALAGRHFDGHAYAAASAAAGAAAVLVERDVGSLGVPSIRVASTLAALGELGRAHRRRWGGRIIGIAGSAGKTTTRSTTGALLSALLPGAVHQTQGNLNNLIGVPLVLLGLEPQHRFGVVEIGTNQPGEVAELTRIASPDVGVLTLIGIEHSEGLGDWDAIESEEAALFDGLDAPGVAIGNADDERVAARLAACRATTRLRYGFGPNADVRCLERRPVALDRQRLRVRGRYGELELELGLLGEAGAYAALAALCVAEELFGRSPPPAALERAFTSAGEPGRLTAHELADGTVVLDDAYNANPASALASLRTAGELARARKARLVLVLGEMRELGALSEREHTRLGDAVARSGAAALVAVGGDARFYVEPARASGVESVFAEDADAALAAVRSSLRAGDVVLVKASRGVRAERVVHGLLARGAA